MSSVALVGLGPWLLLVMLLIRLETPGPAIFTQERWGLGNKKIRVYKMRSMYADRGDTKGVQQTVKNDVRITRIGKFIRRTNIDELPQLVNVLKGDMSLVGPRVHPVGMYAGGVLYEELVPQYKTRHLVKPGITGLAQMRGYRGPTVDADLAKKRIESDLGYISDFNVLLDLKILLQTIRGEVLNSTGS